jgi:hypothetical protein
VFFCLRSTDDDFALDAAEALKHQLHSTFSTQQHKINGKTRCFIVVKITEYRDKY